MGVSASSTLWGPDCTEVISLGCGAEPDIISLLLLFHLKCMILIYVLQCVCTTCMPHTRGVRKKVSDLLELEFWPVVSTIAVSGNRTQVLFKTSTCP